MKQQANTISSNSVRDKTQHRSLVISDIHGNIDALRQVLQEVKRWDSIIFVGDAVGYGASPNQVISELKQHNIFACMGNHDFAVISLETGWFNENAVEAIKWTSKNLSIESKSWLANLPSRKEFTINHLRIGIVHGSPQKPLYEYVMPHTSIFRLESFREEMNVDILILGHTHIPFIKKLPGGLLLNPGSVGQPRDGDSRASYIILEINQEEVDAQIHRIEYPIDQAALKIKEAGLPRFLSERLYLGC